MLIVECQHYRLPVLIEMSNEEGKCLRSATCPHLDPNRIYVLPYGLGCQHWDLFDSADISNHVAKLHPPVIAHDFRIKDVSSGEIIYSQDPRKWEYSGSWPQISEYLSDWAKIKIVGWQPWEKELTIELWRGNQDKIINVYWGGYEDFEAEVKFKNGPDENWTLRSYSFPPIDTKDQATHPDYALARFRVKYLNYRTFKIVVEWWQGVITPSFIPSILEEWGYVEPPEYQLLITEGWGVEIPPEMVLVVTEPWTWFDLLELVLMETWEFDASGPIPLVLNFSEGWNYTEPPEMAQVLIEHWSS